ncbi:hypothetical protein ACJRO7_007940 [Eucalyptus globulus]|uniref:Uncharacterized protein n=1 Tax=Eucalyptus globulus TaxID=34317 RepID=A0ABD3IPW7_EUCGL
MPCLNILTNVSLNDVDSSPILSEVTSGVFKLIGKPETYVMIVLKGSVPMAFGETEQAAASGELVSIGGLNLDVNKKLSAAIASILETKLSIPKSRFFLKFYDTKGSFFGWNGSTFCWRYAQIKLKIVINQSKITEDCDYLIMSICDWI